SRGSATRKSTSCCPKVKLSLKFSASPKKKRHSPEESACRRRRRKRRIQNEHHRVCDCRARPASRKHCGRRPASDYIKRNHHRIRMEESRLADLLRREER